MIIKDSQIILHTLKLLKFPDVGLLLMFIVRVLKFQQYDTFILLRPGRAGCI